MSLGTVLVLIGLIAAALIAVLGLFGQPIPGWALAAAVTLIGLGVLDGAGRLSVH